MKIALDTNAYVSFCQGEEKIVSFIQTAAFIGVPLIVLGELRAGFMYGTNSIKNERRLQKFLSSERVEVLQIDVDTTQYYARIYSELRKNETPIPTNDLWIASMTLQYGLTLLTNDRHFLHIPQLPIVGKQ